MLPDYDVLRDTIEHFEGFITRERVDPMYYRARALARAYWSGNLAAKYGPRATNEMVEKLAGETIGYFLRLANDIEEAISKLED
jgi:hypothetical protein